MKILYLCMKFRSKPKWAIFYAVLRLHRKEIESFLLRGETTNKTQILMTYDIDILRLSIKEQKILI